MLNDSHVTFDLQGETTSQHVHYVYDGSAEDEEQQTQVPKHVVPKFILSFFFQ